MATKQTIFETTTEIESYAVVEQEYEGRPARVLFSGRRQAAQSGIGLDDDPDLLFDYNQRFLELANALYPKRILVLGGGAYTLPTALITALPEAHIDVVELDGGLESISRQFFGLVPNDRLSLHTSDAREFIAKTTAEYDLIIVDVFSELAIPPQFLTLEFVRELYARLSANGSVALNIIASYQGKNVGLIKSQVAAYKSVFSSVIIFPAAHGLTSWLPQNLVLVAQKLPLDVLHHYIRFAPLTELEVSNDDIRHD